MNKPKKILLLGCGQLGSRHLQAVAAMKDIAEVFVVDPNGPSLDLGRLRLKEIPDLNRDIKVKWLNSMDEGCAGGDLCIIATQAKGRVELIKKASMEFGYDRFLIEKIVAQSAGQYLELMQYCDNNRLSVWVNCKSRAYSVHKYIKAKLDPAEPIVFSDFGGNHGLANNGVHSADLFVFYDGAERIESLNSRIDPLLHQSKRGKDIYDLSGILCGYSRKGSSFTLAFSGRHNSPDHISILASRGRFIVDHIQKFAYESYPENDWKWHPIPIDENWMVSHMTKAFASDILSKGSCELPTIKECFPAHEFILEQLSPHFNRLLKVSNDFCPVT